jgi:hypothetical protein
MNPELFRHIAGYAIGFASGGGFEVTLRRNSTLRNRTTSAAITAPTLSAAVTAGASTVSLTSTSLQGRLPEGAKFTIAGNATEYTTTADVEAASNVLSSVPVTPVIAANASLGAVVTITQTYGDESYTAMQGALDQEASAHIEGATRRLHLAGGDGLRAPLEGDLVTTGLDRTERVGHVYTSAPDGSTVARWTVTLSNYPGVA